MNIPQMFKQERSKSNTIITRFAWSMMNRGMTKKDVDAAVSIGAAVRLAPTKPGTGVPVAGLARPADAVSAAVVAAVCDRRAEGIVGQGPEGKGPPRAGTAPSGATVPQAKAWDMVNNNHTSIIIGEPGVGKTWLICQMMEAFSSHGYSVAVCTVTNKAASVLRERTGRKVSTINKLFNIYPGEDTIEHGHLDGRYDVLIIDEAFTIDAPMFAIIMKQTPVGTKIIFAGDDRQLLPVGPGWPLVDVMRARLFPKQVVDVVMRSTGSIPFFTKNYRHGFLPDHTKHADVFFTQCHDRDIVKEAADFITVYGGDVVISPFKDKRSVNVQTINEAIASRVGTDQIDKTFKVGQRVMANRNIHELRVYNGEMYTIVEAPGNKVHLLSDAGVKRKVPKGAMSSFVHGWAITAHKSQGSEAAKVLVILPHEARSFVTRNLVYVAMTRAKVELHILGSGTTFKASMSRQPVRHTALSIMLNNKELSSKLAEPHLKQKEVIDNSWMNFDKIFEEMPF